MDEIKVISVFYKNLEVGRLSRDKNKTRFFFQYHPQFLELNPFPEIFPFGIEKTNRVQVFSQIPSVITDSLPEVSSFGYKLFLIWSKMKYGNDFQFDDFEFLSFMGNRGMGALEFKPAVKLQTEFEIDFDKIHEDSEKIISHSTDNREISEELNIPESFIRLASSVKGESPKILLSQNKNSGDLIPGDTNVSDRYNHYLIKLGIEEEGQLQEKLEYVFYQIAKKSGLKPNGAGMLLDKHLAVLRFDRKTGEKKHILSAQSFADFSQIEEPVYEDVFRMATFLKVPHKNIRRLYRRLIFNMIFGITEVELKDFTFVFDDRLNSWNLAPPYDFKIELAKLQSDKKQIHRLSLNGKNQFIKLEDLLKTADDFAIKNPLAIIEKVSSSIPDFIPLCEEKEIPENVCRKIRDRFQDYSL